MYGQREILKSGEAATPCPREDLVGDQANMPARSVPGRRADVIDVETVNLLFAPSAVITTWRYGVASSRASRSNMLPPRLWRQLRGSASAILTGLPQGDVEGPSEALKRREQPNWATSTAKSKSRPALFALAIGTSSAAAARQVR